MRRALLLSATAVVAAGTLTACGSETIQVASNDTPAVKQGAQLFAERCAGCHTLDAAGAQGSSYEVRDRERVDGPNFNVRKETRENVLYAIRNGGYSGAIMPQNIVVGADADALADYLAKYSGLEKKKSVGPEQAAPAAGS